MIYRIAGSHYTLLIVTLGILLGSAGIMTSQIEFLIENHHLNFIPREVELEDNIALLLAAFGVFVEHRRYLLNIIYEDAIPERIDMFDQYSHNIGVLFILVAVLLVALDLLFLAFNTWGIIFPALKFIEILILFLINLMGFGMLITFGAKSFNAYGNET